MVISVRVILFENEGLMARLNNEAINTIHKTLQYYGVAVWHTSFIEHHTKANKWQTPFLWGVLSPGTTQHWGHWGEFRRMCVNNTFTAIQNLQEKMSSIVHTLNTETLLAQSALKVKDWENARESKKEWARTREQVGSSHTHAHEHEQILSPE